MKRLFGVLILALCLLGIVTTRHSRNSPPSVLAVGSTYEPFPPDPVLGILQQGVLAEEARHHAAVAQAPAATSASPSSPAWDDPMGQRVWDERMKRHKEMMGQPVLPSVQW